MTLITSTICAGEEGDQILDGIGETDLIARYLFSGDAKDASRHNRHATLHGTKGAYVRDDRFGKVLSLPGKDGGPGLACAVIVKTVDAQTREKTGINDLLRD